MPGPPLLASAAAPAVAACSRVLGVSRARSAVVASVFRSCQAIGPLVFSAFLSTRSLRLRLLYLTPTRSSATLAPALLPRAALDLDLLGDDHITRRCCLLSVSSGFCLLAVFVWRWLYGTNLSGCSGLTLGLRGRGRFGSRVPRRSLCISGFVLLSCPGPCGMPARASAACLYCRPCVCGLLACTGGFPC